VRSPLLPMRKRTLEASITPLPPPGRVRIELGALEPVLAVGDAVRTGRVVARGGPLDERRHSPLTGAVVLVDEWGIEIEGEPTDPEPLPESDDLVETARLAGLLGLGGGMFPTWAKLADARGRVDVVLVNACESEPYVTCDHRVLTEHGAAVERGLERIVAGVGAREGRVVRRSHRYLDGYEPMLVERELGRIVPEGKRPPDVGALVLNVQTVWLLERAAAERRPLLERVVTIDGEAVAHPGNLLVPLGTAVGHLLTAGGGDPACAAHLVTGGPMMGRSATLDTPVRAGTIAVLALSAAEVAAPERTACFRCGRCAEVCPYGLPAPLLAAQPGPLTQVCIACGLCELVCPASRPLVVGIRRHAQALHVMGEEVDQAPAASRVAPSEPTAAGAASTEAPVRSVLVTIALFLLALALHLVSPAPAPETREAETLLGGAVERVELTGPPAFRRGDRAAVFFAVAGSQGPLRGVILLDDERQLPGGSPAGVLEAARIRDVVLLESREGVTRNALRRVRVGAAFAGWPATTPVAVTAVSGATISTQRLVDAVNERLDAWQKRGP